MSSSRKNSSDTDKHRGKLIYHSVEESKKRVGENPIDIVEKSITHSDENLFCKYYEKKNGTVTKITVKSTGSGKEYTYSVKKGESPIESTNHNKKELLAKLKKDDKLDFIVKYIDTASTLSRPKTSTKSKSKSKSKGKSKGKSKSKAKSKAKGKSKK